MLSIARLGTGSADYYLHAVASGIEEYYTGAGESPGAWIGAGCRSLALEGEVDAESLHALFLGQSPASGERLFAVADHPRRVAALDICMSAPKSVSLLWALGDDDVNAAVREAHDQAVRDALTYLERHTALARRGAGGAETVPTTGLVAAAFRHRTSRAGDPHLHTHVLVANAVCSRDGRWSALYHYLVFGHVTTATAIYQASLRAGLVERLGVRFGPVERGAAEITGVPRAMIDAFSTRRGEIEARLAELGGSSRRMREIAALETRSPKDATPLPPEAGAEALRELWSTRSREAGYDPLFLRGLVGPPRSPRDAAPSEGRLRRQLLGPDGLTLHDSVFERRDVVRHVAEAMPDGALVSEVERIADAITGDAGVVELCRNGRGGERLLTTRQLLGVEARLMERAVAGLGSGAGLARTGEVEAVLAERSLSGEQEEMVRRLTSSGDGVEIVIGKAGAGKTYALDAARAAWQRSGLQVYGAALAARAAAGLESGAGISSCTLARLCEGIESGRVRLGSTDVLVVDEASMVGSRTLGLLVSEAARGRAKLVLVGDDRQLPEIEAGGAFRSLGEALGASRLEENRRQVAPWEVAALDELRHGEVYAALTAYGEHGRIEAFDSAGEARLAMVAGYLAARGESGEVRMYALRRAEVEELNALARAALQRDGSVGRDELSGGGRSFGIGDEVLFLRNDRRLEVINGLRGVVSGAGPDGLAIETEAGRREVPLAYIEDGHLAHGYASTVHKSQGATVDRAFVLGDDSLYREAGYVAMSRAKEQTELFVVTSAFDDEPGRDPDGLPGGLAARLGRSRPKQMASEELSAASARRDARTGKAPQPEQRGDLAPRLLGEVALHERPAHVVAEIGRPPELPNERRHWVRAAGVMESIRLRLEGPGRPRRLGEEEFAAVLRDEREKFFESIGAFREPQERSRGLGL